MNSSGRWNARGLGGANTRGEEAGFWMQPGIVESIEGEMLRVPRYRATVGMTVICARGVNARQAGSSGAVFAQFQEVAFGIVEVEEALADVVGIGHLGVGDLLEGAVGNLLAVEIGQGGVDVINPEGEMA